MTPKETFADTYLPTPWANPNKILGHTGTTKTHNSQHFNSQLHMQLSYRSQSQTGKSKRSTCHPWWFGEHTEEWRCHPLAHHLGSCPGYCTWDCRNLRTIPAHGRLPHQIRSQSLGCRSGWGWLPRPPATCNINGRAISQEAEYQGGSILCKNI